MVFGYILELWKMSLIIEGVICVIHIICLLWSWWFGEKLDQYNLSKKKKKFQYNCWGFNCATS